MSIRTLTAMLKDKKLLQPDPVTCPFCKATVVFVREKGSVIARCMGKDCGYEVEKGESRNG